MSDNSVQTMVESAMEKKALACKNFAEVIGSVGYKMSSQELEAVAGSLTMMAAAQRNFEVLAEHILKAKEGENKEGSAAQPEVI